MELIARTFAGLEGVLAQEIKEIGGQKIRQSKRAVIYSADKEVLYKSNIYLRTALRVMRPFANFIAFDEGRLYRKIRQIDWSEHFSASDSFAIDTRVSSSVFRHSKYLALKIKDAIVDQFRDNFGVRPSVDKENPSFRLHVHCNDKKFILSEDTSGSSLHRRSYRAAGHPSPLNECLASGLILLAGWDGGSDFLDPFCGSGTLVIEAAQIASKTPANLNREEFGFMRSRDYDRDLFKRVKAEARGKISEIRCKIIGRDIDRELAGIARECVELAGFSEEIVISQKSFESSRGSGGGTIVTNPPYGERLKLDDVKAFYEMIGDTLKQNYKGYTAWILSGNKEAIKSVGLATSRKINLFNGSIECKFQRYQMYAGSKKQSKQEIE